ncbi:GNAT family N-acetyltransferase [Xanthomonas translucens]|uniref:GNAT family N-acetyltransferase n=1 Tax=Xanthomonas campestris pv. translucens TaxID=343 RepID=UPI00071E9956|nr:N-acetyltransferase [Xanthomonas translucens]KTF35829.1 GCN5 family acetyltransferase [Xanthomonas translucens pv. translucens]KWV12822.1 GCN5 family acetyltransferase [Xanthomonas translucens]MCS3359410.1 N-acetyltransferase [Xanthomonas translucens pv. translucens]MCS3372605.1 N-acetyltransferase [Xanthomonas translucens pv. translucens]MCT8273922.1 N-acetyltransferase [Xanthomonas translucens pv. translucens]
MELNIRAETQADHAAIEALTLVAFFRVAHSRHDEQQIIERLRADGALTLSLVVEHDGYIVGHVAVSPLQLSDGSRGWYALGPLSVGPGHQRQGLGTRLVREALAQLQALGAAGCVVLGEPAFYARFGFAPEPGLVLPGVPAGDFQAIAFGDRLPPVAEAEYHQAFLAPG